MTSMIPIRNRTVVSAIMPPRNSFLLPKLFMALQEMTTPTTPQAVTPTPRSKALLVATPASSKKYVENPRTKTIPDKCWQAKTPVDMAVRLRFVPLKQSIHLAEAESSSSSSLVLTMAASLGIMYTLGPYSFRRAFFASSSRFLRTRYHGDSGANGRPLPRKTAEVSALWLPKDKYLDL